MKTLIGAAVGGLVLAAVGYGAGVAAEPEPAPKPVATVSKPAPTPTPQVVTETVTEEVRPQSCLDAIASAYVVMLPTTQFVSDVLAAYLDYPEENLEQFGGRVETIIESASANYDESLFPEFEIDAADCEAGR